MPVVIGVRRPSWIWGEMDADAVRSVNPGGGVGGCADTGVRYSMFEPRWDEADWSEEAEDASENRLFVLESFSDGVRSECGFPSVYPCPDCFEAIV